MTSSTTIKTEVKPTFNRSFENLLTKAAGSTKQADAMPLVFGPVFGLRNLRDGATFSDTLDQRQWETIYSDLVNSRGAPAALPGLDEIYARAAKGGAVPIGIIDLRYKRPNRRLTLAILRAGHDDSEINLPAVEKLEGLFEVKTAFAASSIVPPCYWGFDRQPEGHLGLQVRFELPSELYLSNGPKPDRVEIDFDDGDGFRDVAFDDATSIDYDAEGERRIFLRAHFGDGIRTAAFQFSVLEAKPDHGGRAISEPGVGPAVSSRITARIAHEGQFYNGDIHVYWGRNNRLKKCALLAEGFPGGNIADKVYEYFNGYTGRGTTWNPNARLADELRERGYDVVLLIFGTKGAPIQGNAYVYLAALEWIKNNPELNREVAAMGGSMGGLIARYALTYAERPENRNRVDIGNVTKLVTFDSPHCGANVPLAVQSTARFFIGTGYGKDANEMLDYRCAKQMLIHQRWTAEGTESLTKSEYTNFYAELRNLNPENGGYPTKVKKYAVSNGSLDGLNVVPPMQFMLTVVRNWGVGPHYKFILWSTRNEYRSATYNYADCYFSDRRPNTGLIYGIQGGGTFFSRDGCPGGIAWQFERTKNELDRCVQIIDMKYDGMNCFVPSYSALGIELGDDTDAYGFKPASSAGKIPFDAWYAPKDNQPHCTIDTGIKNWLLEFFPKGG